MIIKRSQYADLADRLAKGQRFIQVLVEPRHVGKTTLVNEFVMASEASSTANNDRSGMNLFSIKLSSFSFKAILLLLIESFPLPSAKDRSLLRFPVVR